MTRRTRSVMRSPCFAITRPSSAIRRRG
jgi:hypothetical protein